MRAHGLGLPRHSVRREIILRRGWEAVQALACAALATAIAFGVAIAAAIQMFGWPP